MDSMGDSGCGTDNQFPRGDNIQCNMPLADALDLSNRFYQKASRPGNWKRTNSLLTDALCENTQYNFRSRNSGLDPCLENDQINYGETWSSHVHHEPANNFSNHEPSHEGPKIGYQVNSYGLGPLSHQVSNIGLSHPNHRAGLHPLGWPNVNSGYYGNNGLVYDMTYPSEMNEYPNQEQQNTLTELYRTLVIKKNAPLSAVSVNDGCLIENIERNRYTQNAQNETFNPYGENLNFSGNYGARSQQNHQNFHDCNQTQSAGLGLGASAQNPNFSGTSGYVAENNLAVMPRVNNLHPSSVRRRHGSSGQPPEVTSRANLALLNDRTRTSPVSHGVYGPYTSGTVNSATGYIGGSYHYRNNQHSISNRSCQGGYSGQHTGLDILHGNSGYENSIQGTGGLELETGPPKLRSQSQKQPKTCNLERVQLTKRRTLSKNQANYHKNLSECSWTQHGSITNTDGSILSQNISERAHLVPNNFNSNENLEFDNKLTAGGKISKNKQFYSKSKSVVHCDRNKRLSFSGCNSINSQQLRTRSRNCLSRRFDPYWIWGAFWSQISQRLKILSFSGFDITKLPL